MMAPVHLTYELSVENTSDLIKLSQKRIYTRRRTFLGITLPIVAAGLVALAVSYFENFDLELGANIGALSYVVGWIVSNLIFCVPPPRLSASSSFMYGRTEFVANTKGIEVSTSKSFWRMDWEGIIDVAEGKKSVMLFIDKTQAILIDNSAFKSSNERREFLAMVSSRIKTSREKIL
ncbi:MAG: YcxB family protein [Pseudomonadota bacterium]